MSFVLVFSWNCGFRAVSYTMPLCYSSTLNSVIPQDTTQYCILSTDPLLKAFEQGKSSQWHFFYCRVMFIEEATMKQHKNHRWSVNNFSLLRIVAFSWQVQVLFKPIWATKLLKWSYSWTTKQFDKECSSLFPPFSIVLGLSCIAYIFSIRSGVIEESKDYLLWSKIIFPLCEK